jgi:hypothetical protein
VKTNSLNSHTNEFQKAQLFQRLGEEAAGLELNAGPSQRCSFSLKSNPTDITNVKTLILQREIKRLGY